MKRSKIDRKIARRRRIVEQCDRILAWMARVEKKHPWLADPKRIDQLWIEAIGQEEVI